MTAPLCPSNSFGGVFGLLRLNNCILDEIPHASHLPFLLIARQLLMKLLSIKILPDLESEFKSHWTILPSPPEL